MADSADSSGEEVLELESPNKKRAVEEKPLVIPNEQLTAQQRLQTLRRVPVKSGKRSNIWKALPKGFSTYSSHANANLKHIVVCNTCMDKELFEQAEINYGKTMSTTNIKNHVHSHHKDVYGKLLLANEIGAVKVEARVQLILLTSLSRSHRLMFVCRNSLLISICLLIWWKTLTFAALQKA